MSTKFNIVPHVCTFLHLKKHYVHTQKTLLLHYRKQYTYMFGDWIERGRSFIKYKNGRSFQNCSSNCYSLFLSSRQFQSTFTNLTVLKLIWEISDDKETIIYFNGRDDSRNTAFKWFVLIPTWNNILDTTEGMCNKKEKLQFPLKCSSVIYCTGYWTFTFPYFIRTAH